MNLKNTSPLIQRKQVINTDDSDLKQDQISDLFAKFSSNQILVAPDNKVEILEQIETTFSDEEDQTDEGEEESSSGDVEEEKKISQDHSYMDNNFWRPPSPFSIDELLKEMS